jgi:penicillin-binding protein 1A
MAKSRRRLAPILRWLLWGSILFTLIAIGGVFLIYSRYAPTIPKFSSLRDYRPKIGTRIYAADRQLIGEFAAESRILLPYERIPRLLFQAFISAEDQRFFEHSGLDFVGIVEAIAQKALHPDRKLRGASTITQQVAKSLLATTEDYESATARTAERKIREALLARRLEKNLNKEDILYVYVNQIFLGHKAYGVQAAAEHYFRKNVWDLTLAEMATLAGLPQRPSDYSPVTHPDAARKRRGYVLRRMFEEGYISREDFDKANNEPIKAYPLYEHYLEIAPYFTEHIRRELVDTYGEKKILEEGLQVFTSLDLNAQQAADDAISWGLHELDRRQGYRGALTHLVHKDVPRFLELYRQELGLAEDELPLFEAEKNYLGVVIGFDTLGRQVFVNVAGERGLLPLAGMRWARKPDPTVRVDNALINDARSVLKMDDVILLAPTTVVDLNKDIYGKTVKDEISLQLPLFLLVQAPFAQGSLLSVDPYSGNVVAMVGGADFTDSSYDRVFQACREPGSSFKPIVYSAAIEKLNYTPSTLIEDKPIIFEDADGGSSWKPNNAGEKFRGTLPLRTCLQDSINTAAVRMADALGIDTIIDYARRFGITTPLKRELGTAIGSSCTTLSDLIHVYLALNQYGVHRDLKLVQRIYDQDGKLLLDESDPRDASLDLLGRIDRGNVKFNTPEKRVLAETTAYVMIDMLKNAVQNGTGTRASNTGFSVAGKTGTTNDSYDAWFMGFTRDLVTGVWIGHDKKERPLGVNEEGGKTAAPIWSYYVTHALVDHTGSTPQKKQQGDFEPPAGVVQIAIDPESGLLARPGERAVMQYYKQGTEPTTLAPDKTQFNPEQIDVFGADTPL